MYFNLNIIPTRRQRNFSVGGEFKTVSYEQDEITYTFTTPRLENISLRNFN